jgi:hypothetical protein
MLMMRAYCGDMQANKKKWSDLTRNQQSLVIVGGAVEAILTAAALVSLAKRPRSGVRGPKALWVASLIVQPVGPLAYFALGRRSA